MRTLDGYDPANDSTTVFCQIGSYRIDEPKIKVLARFICRELGVDDHELSISLVGSDEIQHEIIATVVSAINRTRYCSISHAEFLRRVTQDDALARQLIADPRSATLTDAERVMVVFTETQWENWAFGGGRLLHA